ncbi:MAG: PQQ-binding-like beta-propeller repeat protein [bacterium]|nr:PQQ-binding-like beta-propeller repeat protein [bacterium]
MTINACINNKIRCVVIIVCLLLSCWNLQAASLKGSTSDKDIATSINSSLQSLPWSCLQQDVGHIGRSTLSGPDALPIIKWRKHVHGYIIGQPIVDKEGCVYFCSTAGMFFAIKPDGSESSINLDSSVDSTCAMGQSGTIYVLCKDGSLCAIDREKLRLKWKHSANIPCSWSSPVVVGDMDEVIYFGANDGNLYAIDRDGKLIWKVLLGAAIQSTPAIDKSGTIYISTTLGSLYAVFPDGKMKWEKGIRISPFSSPCISPDDESIYVTTLDNTLAVIAQDGNINITKVNSSIYSLPAFGHNQEIYLGTEDGLCIITPKGIQYVATGDIFRSHPIVDAKGVVYIASRSGNIYAVLPDGKIKWKYSVGMTPGPISLGPGDTLYIGDRNGDVYGLVSTQKALPQKGVKLPDSPKYLQASLKGLKNTLLWKDMGNREDGFIIERKTPDRDYTEIGRVDKNINSFKDTDLAPAMDYSYRVYAYNSGGISNYSNESIITTPQMPPSAPSSLRITIQGGTGTSLLWQDTSSNESGFLLERMKGSSDGSTYTELCRLTSNTVEYQDNNLLPDTDYSYRVYAYNDAGLSGYSNEVMIHTPQIPPSAPDMLVLMKFNMHEVTISWRDKSQDEQGFILERMTDKGTWTTIFTLGTNSLQFTDKQIKLNNKYSYRVCAYNHVGRSGYSNILEIHTVPNLPALPTDLKAAFVSDKGVLLTWMDNSTNENGFKIVKAIKGQKDYKFVCTLEPNTTSYEDARVIPGTTYLYRIVSFNSFGRTEYTRPITITIPSAPPSRPENVEALLVEPTRVKIAWKDTSVIKRGTVSDRGASSFKIQRKDPGKKGFETIAAVGPDSVHYTDTNLLPDTNYSYQVIACNKDGEGVSDTVNIKTSRGLPQPPSGLKIADVSQTSITISWAGDGNEAGFRLERRKVNTPYEEIAIMGAAITSYKDTDVLPKTTYFYRVCAYNLSVYSKYSSEVQATTRDTQPFFPSELKALIEEDGIELSWQDNSSNEKGFKIERKQDTAQFEEIAVLEADKRYYKDKNISPKTIYTYRVYAYNDIGNSRYSYEVKVVTSAPPTPPAPPAKLSGMAASPSQINLSWMDESSDEEGFIIEKKIREKFYEAGRVSKNNTIFTEINLMPKTAYTYRASTYNKFGVSDYSNEITITTLEPPLQFPDKLEASAVCEGCVKITWQDNSDGETGFILERASQTGDFQETAIIAPEGISYIDIKLLPDSIYHYQIRAVKGNEYSGYSNRAMVRTRNAIPRLPDNLILVTTSRNGITIAWKDNSSNETGFRIERAEGTSTEYKTISTIRQDTRSFEDKDVLGGASYQYRVAAYNEIGESQMSNVLFAVALAPGEVSLLQKSIQYSLSQEEFAPRLKWSFQTGQGIRNSSAVLSQDGKMFLCSTDGKVYCLKSDTGEQLWAYETLKSIVSSPVLDNDTIYVGSRDGYLYSLTTDGRLRWKYYAGDSIESSPTVHNGVIYVISISGDIYALLTDSAIKWRIRLKGMGFSSPVIGFDGKIFVGVNGDQETSAVYAISEWGKIMWKYPVVYGIRSAAGVGYDGSIYVGVKDKNGDNLYSFSETGELKWKYSTSGWINQSIMVGPDGGIFVVSNEPTGTSKIYRINAVGQCDWSRQIGWIYSAAAIDSSGMVYIGGKETIYALSRDGEIVWAYTADSRIASSPAISKDGIVYFGCMDGKIYALERGNSSPNAPSSLTIKACSSSSMELSWSDNANDETGFVIERRIGEDEFNVVTTVPVNTTSFTDTGLMAATRYEYRLSAYNAKGESDYSDTCACKTFSKAPNGIKDVYIINTDKGSSLQIRWKNPSDNNFSHVRMYRSIVHGEIGSLIKNNINTDDIIDENLVANLMYYYTLNVVDKHGVEVLSQEQYPGAVSK